MKRVIICLAAGTAAALALTSCHKTEKETTAVLPSIEVATPVVDSVVIYKSYPGRLSATDEVQLVARVNGYLREVDYSSGQFVRKGDVLFRIEDTSYRDAVSQATASLSQAKANLEYAERRYNAMTEALKGDAVSEMEVAQAKSTLEECKSAVKTAEANLQTANTQLSYCTVRAPFDGHMSNNLYSHGTYLAGEGSPVTLATIYADHKMTATFAIEDDATLATIKRNMEANAIDFNAIPVNFTESLPHKYTGKLTYMAPNVNTSTGTLKLQASIENQHNELHSGMFASIDLPVDTDPKAILIADASIGSDQLGKYVYVVNDSNRIEYTPIEVGGLIADTMRIVTKGLTPESRYVTKALLKVRQGMEVNPVQAGR